MGIPILNVTPKPSLGEAFGQGVAGGLGKLIQRHRTEKAGEAAGLPKGFASNFDSPEEAIKAYSTLRQMQMLQGLQKMFQPDQQAPQGELEQRFQGLSPEGQRTGLNALMGDEMGGGLPSENALEALREYQGGQPPPQQPQQAQRRPPQIKPEHLIAAAGTPLEQPLRTLYETQERKAAKLETSEREPYVASAKEYFKDLRDKQRSLPITKSAIEAETQAILRGDIDPLSGGHFATIARQLGAPPALVSVFETPGSKEFRTAQKTFLSNTLNETMRGTTSGKQIELVEGLLAEVGARKEANLASVWLLQTKALLDEKEIQLASQFKKQGIPSYDIPDLVAEQLEPYRQDLSDQYMEAINSLTSGKK